MDRQKALSESNAQFRKELDMAKAANNSHTCYRDQRVYNTRGSYAHVVA